jgi:hypothetical protein
MKRLFIILWMLTVSAQIGLSQNLINFYNFDNVNQSLMVNPSGQHHFRTVVGIPAISGVNVHVQNTVFQLGEYFNNNPSQENINNIVTSLSERERLNFYQSADLLFVGFGLKKGYLSFGVQQEATLNTVLPGDLFKFLYYGNEGSNNALNIDATTLNMEALIQINYHLGYQHYLLDSALIVGGRFKFISGTAHAHLRNADINVYADMFEWTIKTNVLMESSGSAYLEDYGSLNPIELIKPGNPGWGVDLGATYLLPKMKFSGAILNVGQISWKVDNKMYQSKGEYTWEGIVISENDYDQDIDAIGDSIIEALEFEEIAPYNYKTSLPSKVLLNYEFSLSPKHAFAATYQGDIWKGSIYHTMGVTYIGRYAKRFNLLLGYSKQLDGNNNIGLGLSTAMGPLQFYILSDNAWGFYKPSELSSTSVRLGLNLVIFDRKTPKEKKVKS